MLLAWTGLRCRHGRATEGVAPDDREFIEINAAWADGADAVDRLVAEYRAAAN